VKFRRTRLKVRGVRKRTLVGSSFVRFAKANGVTAVVAGRYCGVNSTGGVLNVAKHFKKLVCF